MPWLTNHLDAIAKPDHWGQRPGDTAAVESCALAATALVGHDRLAEARPLLDKLCEMQSADGSLGIYEGAGHPHWPTSHAVAAWSAAIHSPLAEQEGERFKACVVRACDFLLRPEFQGKPIAPEVAQQEVGHNTTLIGWPWVESTHSWQEPTAMALVALKAAGMRGHARAAEAVNLLIDRILPAGGCNYGNTFVLGQQLRPHLQPTGITMLALANENDRDGRIAKSAAWATGALDGQPTTASLACALLGLAAQQRPIADAAARLEAAVAMPAARLGAYLPRFTWAALAALGEKCPLVVMSRAGGVA